ncbi:glycoside hydrolase family 32 protein [Dinghuibacter silviterrae]|uniref:Levanase/fructan beta-fructosidase n=1 Tax=Dinghuibacter silviterrae TaxID=1539049 RepID=A0A4R8DTZ5_9BACT|nr:glycoside hydrolase family 32 protein [Dinghuibacter silviterrae]TDX00601.1 levanase/fructan beta-fructosidase [Dinghuibacter silviterrae]
MVRIIVALLIATSASAQVPTPQWRPVYHFTPERNWTNDPNGLLVLHGVYHLYNQQNPYANVWGHMSWGHATSTDLVHWKHLPIALPEGADTTERFSGCAVYDAHNTSGLCKGGCIVAIYTADQPNLKRESQYIAYSNDGGMHFTDYKGNPVIDLHRKDFRDPNVSWNEKLHRWLMVVSLVDLHQVRFYISRDVKNWTALSDFGPAGYTGSAWECPFFVHLPVVNKPGLWKWVLAVSAWGPSGAPSIQYFVGDFDGKHFTTKQSSDFIDKGNTFYAAIPWNGQPEGQRTLLGWLVPEPRPTYPWRGAMSIPRDLSLREKEGVYLLCQAPAALIQAKLGAPAVDQGTRRGDLRAAAPRGDQPLFKGNAWWLTATFRPNNAARFGVVFGGGVRVGYDRATATVFVDRSHGDTTGLSPDKLIQSMPIGPIADTLTMTVLLDKSILEVFVNGQVLTTWVFPTGDDVRTFGKGAERLQLWNMEKLP